MNILNNTYYLFVSILVCLTLGASDAKKMEFYKSINGKSSQASSQQKVIDPQKQKIDQKQKDAHAKELAQTETQLRSLFVEMFVTKYAIKNMGVYDWLVPKKFKTPNYDQLTLLEKLKYRDDLSAKHNNLIDEIQKLSKKIPDKNRILQIKEEAIILGADQIGDNLQRYYEDKYLTSDTINNDDDNAKD